MQQKMWAILVHLSMNMWAKKHEDLYENFDEDTWNYILEECPKADVNTIVLDVGDGVQYTSHPELSIRNAWSAQRVHTEIQRCKALGITLIPKLNFSASHDTWLGKYRNIRSTEEYRKVCGDLIREVYELFDKPAYVHIGMDEENDRWQGNDFTYRWDDLRYLIDVVTSLDAKPWIWACPLFDYPEEYGKHIGATEAILSPWYYNAFRPEHYTPIESRAEYVAYYNEDRYAELGLKYVEEDPFLVNVRKLAIPLLKEGYRYVPCASVYSRCDYNTPDLVEYFRDNTPDDQLIGFITAPWFNTMPDKKMYFEESFRFLKEAKDTFYP